MMFFVYALCDPRVEFHDSIIKFKPFYIGKGKGDRPYSHIKEAKGIRKPTTKNTLKIDHIKDILTAGLEPIIIKMHEGLECKTAYIIEIYYIKKYGRIDIDNGGILTNRVIDQRSLGGGKKGMKHTKPRSIEHRKKISVYNTGKKWSAEQKANRCGKGNPMFGKHVADKTKKIWSKQRSGKNNPNALEWEITTPNGEKHTVVGLRKWCDEHDYKYDMVYHSRSGFIVIKKGHGKGGGRKHAE